MHLQAASAYHLASLRARNCSPLTLRQYAQVEGAFIGFVSGDGPPAPLAALSVENVQRWAERLRTEPRASSRFGARPALPSNDTIGQYVGFLKFWAKFLATEGFFPSDPLGRLRLPKRAQKAVQAFSRQQVELLVALTATTRDPLRNRALLLFLVDTGVRAAELCGLRLEHVTLASNKHPGRARVLGKGAKERFVLFGGKTSGALTKYLSVERPPTRSAALFVSRQGSPLSRTALLELVGDLGRRAGIEGQRVSPHVFRHTFALEYLRAHPGQISQLQALLGHAQLVQVQHYARITETDVEGSYASFLDDWSVRGASAGLPRRASEDPAPVSAASLVKPALTLAPAAPRRRRGPSARAV